MPTTACYQHTCHNAITNTRGQESAMTEQSLTTDRRTVAPLITHLIEHKKIPRDEINRIRALLDGQESEADPE